MHSLGKVNQFACLHLDAVVIIYDVVTGFQSAMMEVLDLVDTGVVVVGEGRPCDTRAGLDTCHVIPDGVCKVGNTNISHNSAVVRLLADDMNNSPTITPTPAAWQVEIMLANCERLPRFEVRVYETGW